jgi:hypothetical protein
MSKKQTKEKKPKKPKTGTSTQDEGSGQPPVVPPKPPGS